MTFDLPVMGSETKKVDRKGTVELSEAIWRLLVIGMYLK